MRTGTFGNSGLNRAGDLPSVHALRVEWCGLEKWGVQIALVGYAWACLGVLGAYWTPWAVRRTVSSASPSFSDFRGAPGPSGSSLLGIALLRNGLVTLPACLLGVALPFAFAITQVRSMGSIALPLMFAFGMLGRRIAHGHTHVSVAPADPAPSTLRS